MADWHTLPAEIRLMILEFTADSKPKFKPKSSRRQKRYLAALATVSREWQHYFEAVNFGRLTLELTLDTLQSLSSIVSGTHRESLVRHISVWVDLSSFPLPVSISRESKVKNLGETITWLFLCLSQWQACTHSGLTLELCASKLFPTDFFEGWKWYSLPMAPVVTALILPRRTTPCMDDHQFRHLFAALPRLQSFRWELFTDALGRRAPEPDYGVWHGREPPHHTGLAFFQSISPMVKSLSIFSEDLDSEYTTASLRILYPENWESESSSWMTESLHWIAEALVRQSTQLTHLSACYIIDASTFLDTALRSPLNTTPEEWKLRFSSYPHGEPPKYHDWNPSPP